MNGAQDPVDLLAVAGIVGAAVSFLLYRVFKPAPPACHTLAAASSAASTLTSAAGGNVVLGASLQRGLKRAQARARAAAP